jgi:hypothetical protein
VVGGDEGQSADSEWVVQGQKGGCTEGGGGRGIIIIRGWPVIRPPSLFSCMVTPCWPGPFSPHFLTGWPIPLSLPSSFCDPV